MQIRLYVTQPLSEGAEVFLSVFSGIGFKEAFSNRSYKSLISVSKSDYNRYDEQRVVTVTEHPGFWGAPYYRLEQPKGEDWHGQ